MSKIKVGQIYRYISNDYLKLEEDFVVTYLFRYVACCLRYDGETMHLPISNFEDYTLIAEYPTWQEAVNSEYFKND